jgi:hypothetical protein
LPPRQIYLLLSMTQASTAIREILLVPLDRTEWRGAFLFLAAFALAVTPVGDVSLKYARAKRDGSLVQF